MDHVNGEGGERMHHGGDSRIGNPRFHHNTVNRKMRMSENSHQPKSSDRHTVFNKLITGTMNFAGDTSVVRLVGDGGRGEAARGSMVRCSS